MRVEPSNYCQLRAQLSPHDGFEGSANSVATPNWKAAHSFHTSSAMEADPSAWLGRYEEEFDRRPNTPEELVAFVKNRGGALSYAAAKKPGDW